MKIGIDLLGSLTAAGHRADDKACTVGGIATNEDILRILRMLRFEEAHSQQHEFGFDDFRLTLLNHDGTTTLRIRFPVNLLHTDTSQFTVLT